ncbi:MAG: endo-1,4-beta-xylanase [Verrucomicrobia bacterium]|nr:endo-1,4-beta-xylanase [Verrucomicrobiota bacterium]
MTLKHYITTSILTGIMAISPALSDAGAIWLEQTEIEPVILHQRQDLPLAEVSFSAAEWEFSRPPASPDGRNMMRIVLEVDKPLPAGERLVLECQIRAVPSEGRSGQAGFVLDVVRLPLGEGLRLDSQFRHILLAGEDWETFQIPIPANDSDLDTWGLVFSPSFFDQPVAVRNLRLRSLREGEQFAPTLAYAGQELDAPWRAEAARRIDRYRKADLNIKVIDVFGAPVEGAKVTVNQLRHGYPFGTAVVASRIVDADIPFVDPTMTREQFLRDNERYRQEVLRLFNHVVFENDLKWHLWGGAVPRFSQQATLDALDWLRNHDLPAKGHTLVWASWSQTPRWLRQLENDPQKLQATILRHIRDVASATRDRTHAWDVLNEPMSHRHIIDILGTKAVAEWFRTAREELPNHTLLLNDFDLVGNGGSPRQRQGISRLIEDLRKYDGLPDVIGFQSHFWSDRLTPPETIWEILDEMYAATGLPMAVTEFDTNFPNDEIQADYTRDFLTAWFAHPATKSFLMWGFWGGAHWFGDRGAMFLRDWTPKPNLAAYEQLVLKEWWTRANLQSDVDGTASVRAFHGRHEIKVELADRPASVRRVELDANGLDVTIILHPVEFRPEYH